MGALAAGTQQRASWWHCGMYIHWCSGFRRLGLDGKPVLEVCHNGISPPDDSTGQALALILGHRDLGCFSILIRVDKVSQVGIVPACVSYVASNATIPIQVRA